MIGMWASVHADVDGARVAVSTLARIRERQRACLIECDSNLIIGWSACGLCGIRVAYAAGVHCKMLIFSYCVVLIRTIPPTKHPHSRPAKHSGCMLYTLYAQIDVLQSIC